MKRNTLSDFWTLVEKTDKCWLWKGSKKVLDYGEFHYEGKTEAAHRLAYKLVKGDIPKGLQIDHLCRVHSCVNPEHLEAVTAKVNGLRGTSTAAENARKTQCYRGHPLSGNNLYVNPRGERYCLICKRRLQREWKARARQKDYVPRRTWKQAPFPYVLIDKANFKPLI